MVETPASMADDMVNAESKSIQIPLHNKSNIQHIVPIKKANKSTGAVYCPATLYDGFVTSNSLSNAST